MNCTLSKHFFKSVENVRYGLFKLSTATNVEHIGGKKILRVIQCDQRHKYKKTAMLPDTGDRTVICMFAVASSQVERKILYKNLNVPI